MFEENPLEGVGREMVPEDMLEAAEASEAAPEAEGETLPTSLSPEEVLAHVGGPEEETEALPEAAPEDKGMGAVEPVLPEETLEEGAAPQAEVPVPPPEAMQGAPVFTAAAFEAPGTMTPSAPPHMGEALPPSP